MEVAYWDMIQMKGITRSEHWVRATNAPNINTDIVPPLTFVKLHLKAQKARQEL
jgi:hypothetical protein